MLRLVGPAGDSLGFVAFDAERVECFRSKKDECELRMEAGPRSDRGERIVLRGSVQDFDILTESLRAMLGTKGPAQVEAILEAA